MEKVNLFDAITLLQSKKQFGDLLVKVNHDVLGEVQDFITVQRIADPHTRFYANVEGLYPRTLEGKRLSGGTFSLVPTGDKLRVSEEIVEWAHIATEQMKQMSEKFLSVTH